MTGRSGLVQFKGWFCQIKPLLGVQAVHIGSDQGQKLPLFSFHHLAIGHSPSGQDIHSACAGLSPRLIWLTAHSGPGIPCTARADEHSGRRQKGATRDDKGWEWHGLILDGQFCCWKVYLKERPLMIEHDKIARVTFAIPYGPVP